MAKAQVTKVVVTPQYVTNDEHHSSSYSKTNSSSITHSTVQVTPQTLPQTGFHNMASIPFGLSLMALVGLIITKIILNKRSD